MFYPAVTSVSFRKNTPKEIIEAVREAGLTAIEWGSDVHVQPGDLTFAADIRKQTEAAGLTVCSYGTYYKLGNHENPAKEFADILATAEVLGASVIRIWGDGEGSANISAARRQCLTEEALCLSRMAAERNIVISLECHHGTITDRYESAVEFLTRVHAPYFLTYWQPNQFESDTYNQEAAAALAPFTTNLHIFSWDAENRYPLAHGKDIWEKYLEPFRKQDRDFALILEFMPDDRIETLAREAATLKSWLSALPALH